MLSCQLFKSQSPESGRHFLLISVINCVSWETPGCQRDGGMQEDAAVRSFKQADDSGWEMTPPFPMEMPADHSLYTPSGRYMAANSGNHKI